MTTNIWNGEVMLRYAWCEVLAPPMEKTILVVAAAMSRIVVGHYNITTTGHNITKPELLVQLRV